MRILVTGGAGYIGSVLIPMLLKQKHRVTLMDTFNWGIKPILHFAGDPNLEIVSDDIRDAEAVRSAIRGHDLVIHLAAIVGYPACDSDRYRAISTNVEGTSNITRALDGRGIIFFSTGSIYGKVEGVCDEETPVNPLTLYGSTKWEAEHLVLEVRGVGLRFATLFGVAPRLRPDLLINDLVYQAFTTRRILLYEGHYRRTFLHVRDAARSCLMAIERYEEMAGKPFNVGDELMNLSKREVAGKIQEYIDCQLHEADIGSDCDKRDYEVSYARIKALGYRAEITVDEGIKELIRVIKHIKAPDEWRNS
jgi:nucleoside-diphosphate-sugar epimerase